MYCGAELPEPTAAPPAPAPRKELPKDLDKAFQRAMLHGDMRQLRQVLGGVEERVVVAEPPVTSPSSGGGSGPGPGERPLLAKPVTPSPAADAAPSVRQASGLPAHLRSPPGERGEGGREAARSIDDLYAALSQAVVRAGAWEDDPAAAVQALTQARAGIDQLVERLGEIEGPPELILPPFRQPWALVVEPPGSDEALPFVAEALGVDPATARQVAVMGHPRAALRSGDVADLEARAERYREGLGLRARVIDEAALRAQPAARLALALPAEGPWRSAPSASWEPESSALAKLVTRDDPPPALRLVVVGEVVITRYRELRGRRKDDSRLSSHGDRRLRVLDLHHDGGVLRVVEGVTELSGWEGLDPRSSALAFRGLAEAMARRWPGLPVTARCLCRPTRQPQARDDGRVEASGWPAFEEHSRACRLLYGAASR
jgi:hypothetical protein